MTRSGNPVRLWALAGFVIPATLYWFSVVPDVGSWDVGEMQTVTYILGIAHTTGYPMFVIVGWLFSHIFAFGDVAWRVNLFAALCIAGACCALTCIQTRLGVRPPIALLASTFFATGTIVWSHAVRVDVLSMAVLFAAIILLCLIRWSQDRDVTSFFAACAFVGLSLGDHLVIIWLLPSVVLYVIANKHAVTLRQSIAGVLVTFLTVAAVYAYIPLRSAIVTAARDDRTLALGFPPGHPYWDYGDPRVPANFFALVTGAQVHAQSSFAAMLSIRTLVLGAAHFATMTFAEFSIVGALAIVTGVWVGFRKHRDVSVFIALACVLIAVFTSAFTAETDPDRYYMVLFALLTVFFGLGASELVDAFAQRRSATVAVATALAVVIGVGIYRERAIFGWHYDRWGSDYARRVRLHTPNDAVIVAPWVLASPLAYEEYVEKSYGDRIVDAGSLELNRTALYSVMSSRPVYVILDRDVPRGFRLVEVDNGDPPIFRVSRAR